MTDKPQKTTIFVVTADAVTDVAGELLDSGFVAGAFTSMEAVNAYIETVEETYMHKRSDYTVTETGLKCRNCRPQPPTEETT